MFSIFLKMGWFFKENWQRYTLAILLLMVGSLMEILPPKIIGMSIDEMYLGTLTTDRLIGILLFFTALSFAIYAITYIWVSRLFGGAYLAERTLRAMLMRHFLRMTPTFFQRNRTGDLMARATNDLKAVSMTTGFGVMTIVETISYTAMILLTMFFFISWELTLMAILPLPIMAYAINRYGRKIHARFSLAQNAFGALNDQVLESVSGVRVIRAYVQETADQRRFQEMTDDVYQKNIAVARVDSLIEPTVKLLIGISYMIGILYGGYLVFQQKLTLGELVSFNVYLGMLIWPMFGIGELINVLQRGNASLDRVNETLGYQPDVQDAQETIAVEVPTEICYDRVTFRYPAARGEQLKDVSFTLQRGQTLGIVGRTGSGKTTLLRQLLREFPLGEGRITISGQPLEKIALDNVKRWIGYVPQEQILFSKTVRENVLFGRRDGTQEKLQHTLQLASFDQDVQRLPDGLETLVGEKGVALSGGQKQRVSIARALMIDPEILILDDAMSAVDGKTEAEMLTSIRRERAGKTTLIATHRMFAVQHADWILVLDEGRVVQEGTHEQLMEQGGWYKEQYERQQAEERLNEGQVKP